MELKIFGQRIYLDPNLVVRETKIPRRGGEIFNSKETPKLKKIEMTNKICWKKVFVLNNGLKMKNVPQ